MTVLPILENIGLQNQSSLKTGVHISGTPCHYIVILSDRPTAATYPAASILGLMTITSLVTAWLCFAQRLIMPAARRARPGCAGVPEETTGMHSGRR